MNTAIWLAAPPGATLVILDNLDWYCDVASDEDKLSYEVIVTKIEESLHFLVKKIIIRNVLNFWSRGRMAVGLSTTFAISAYHHEHFEFEPPSEQDAQHYVVKFVSDLRQVGGFLRVFRFPPPIKLTSTIKLKYCWKIE